MNKILALVIGFIALVYLFTLKGSLGNNTMTMNTPPFETSMERGRFAQVVALAERGTFSVDIFRDYLRPDIAWYNGHFYPAFPPGVSFIAAGAYFIGRYVNMGQLFATLPTLVASLLTAAVIIQICLELGLGAVAAGLAAIVFCLATPAFPYSVTLSAHPFSALLTAAMFLTYLVIRKHPDNPWLLLALWFSFAANLFVDYPNLAITAPIVAVATLHAFFLTPPKGKSQTSVLTKLLFSLAGLAIVLIPFFIFNELHFGKPIAFTNTYNLKRLTTQGVQFSESALSNSLFNQKSYAGRFSISTIPFGIAVLLVSEDRGLFIYAPVLIFLFVGYFFLKKTHNVPAFIIELVFILDILIYASFDDPWGGWGFGPRYLIVSLPLIAVLVGVAYEKLIQNKAILKFIFFVLLIASIGINLSGALTTNAVPPGVEAIGLNMKDNFLLNIDYLNAGSSSSFVYNQFLTNVLNPTQYALTLLSIISVGILALPWLINKQLHSKQS
ncbi:MAG TPA: hypothetical protein VMR81_05405 [Patescibacteria group bacterium]|nr:hypothetical protein [Patescibacteria group bacterium]